MTPQYITEIQDGKTVAAAIYDIPEWSAKYKDLIVKYMHEYQR